MDWFNSSQFTSFAKTALAQAQKSIDKALDIKDDTLPPPTVSAASSSSAATAATAATATSASTSAPPTAPSSATSSSAPSGSALSFTSLKSFAEFATFSSSDFLPPSVAAAPSTATIAAAAAAAAPVAPHPPTNAATSDAPLPPPDPALPAAHKTESFSNANLTVATFESDASTLPEHLSPGSAGTASSIDSVSIHNNNNNSSSNDSNNGNIHDATRATTADSDDQSFLPSSSLGTKVIMVHLDSTPAPVAPYDKAANPQVTHSTEPPSNDHHKSTLQDDAHRTAADSSLPHDTTINNTSSESQSETSRLLHVISERERKLVSLSIEHSRLSEAYDLLKTEHEQALAQMQHLQTHQRPSSSHSKEDELLALIREKEEQIAGLLEEGEKLSKKELTLNNSLKKLSAKCKQAEAETATAKEKLAEVESALQTLKTQVVELQNKELNYQDTISKVNSIGEAQSKEIASLKKELEHGREETASLKSALDKSFKELNDLRKMNAEAAKAVQEASFAAEVNAKEELKALLERQRLEAASVHETLTNQIADLQGSIVRAEQQAQRREDSLRREIADLQEQLHSAETRNQELTTSLSQATRPLLRQIETLRAAQAHQSASWESIEQTLNSRVEEAQTALQHAAEKERLAVIKALELTQQVGSLEAQLSSERQQRSRFQAQVEVLKETAAKFESDAARVGATLESIRDISNKELDALRKEKSQLLAQIQTLETKLDGETKRADLLKDALEKKEASAGFLPHAHAHAHDSSGRSYAGTPSLPGTNGVGNGDLDALWSASAHHGSGRRSNLSTSSTPLLPPSSGLAGDWIASLTAVGASPAVLDQLRSILKQKEGEVASLQRQVEELQRTQAVMAESLVETSANYEQLQVQLKQIDVLQQQKSELEQRYDALLVLYGEKAEEAEELKLDLLDVKALYRNQIQELVGKLEAQSPSKS